MTDLTLIDALKRQVRERGNAVAMQAGEHAWTFADLDRDSNRIAGALAAMGVGKGDRVACLTKHHPQCLLLCLAACKIGAVCMPVNWRLAGPEIQQIMNHGEARFLMVDEAFSAQFKPEAGLPTPMIRQIVTTERPAAGFPSLAEWSAGYPDVFEAHPAGTDAPAIQLYSSGTTGLPKGIVLSHSGLIQSCVVAADSWKFDENGVLGNPLPTFHIAGMVVMLMTITCGGPNLTYPDFVPAEFIASIGKGGITHTFLVPGMIMFMVDSPAAPTGDYRTLRLVSYGGSPISERVLKDAIALFDCDFVQAYGLTETTGSVTLLSPEAHRQGGDLLRSAGTPVADTIIKIVDPATFQDLGENETGEVWSKSVRNFLEYWRSPEATAAAYPEGRGADGGWFRTGDGGYIKEGYLYINDRIKDMVISGGENIYPAEIENVLMSHPHVADCAIIGVPDAKWGESIKALVVKKPGCEPDSAEIIAWMRKRLAGFKCPKSVDYIEALPRNPSGKILKRILREPYWKDQQRAVH